MEIITMSWPSLGSIDPEKSLLFLPIVPLEEHGPHLPIGVDCHCAVEGCRRSAVKLEGQSSLRPYVFPLIPLGVARETADFPGTLSLTEQVFFPLVVELLSSVSRWGFRYAVVVSPHGSPAHLAAIHAAIAAVEKNHPLRVAEPFAHWFFHLPHDPAPNAIPDIHAGRVETSLMLALHPEQVDREAARQLSPVAIDNLHSSGTWREKGASGGYLGNPAAASAEEGQRLLPGLEIWADAAMDLLKGVAWPPPPLIQGLTNKFLRMDP
ncbi:creatininase family protein [Heliobacterium gestii]|uniref:Creatininase family protein n=1 Tax=Heliomicrobium gestii TaxID=2699 RepID=A0A845LE95_HELGE|nr:creatininase family protein [Heliomicrobium gestii]MBM7867430.1 creatinine amidohydrolase [Heliomicrobium gestii]MZP43694.1 creatininase family protein [Heliomicrobium gestii]